MYNIRILLVNDNIDGLQKMVSEIDMNVCGTLELFSVTLYSVVDLTISWRQNENHEQRHNIDNDIHTTCFFDLTSISNDWKNVKYVAVTQKQHTTLIRHIRPITFHQHQKSGLYVIIYV